MCCNSWGRKESDTTEQLNWTELNWTVGDGLWDIANFWSVSLHSFQPKETTVQMGCWIVCSLTILLHSALFKEAVSYRLYQPGSSEGKLPAGFPRNHGGWLRRWTEAEVRVSHPRLPSCGAVPLADALALPSGSVPWLQLSCSCLPLWCCRPLSPVTLLS